MGDIRELLASINKEKMIWVGIAIAVLLLLLTITK